MKKKGVVITAISSLLVLACAFTVAKPVVSFAKALAKEDTGAFVEVYEKDSTAFSMNRSTSGYVDVLDGELPDFAQWDESEAFVTVYELDDEIVPQEITTQNNADAEIHYLRETRSGDIPSAFWNLDTSGDYQYALVEVQNFVYTDFCFGCDTEGYIAMSFGSLDTNGKNMRISIINSANDSVVSSWTGDPESIAGLGWGGLSEFRTYYFKFEAYEADSVSGTGWIMHD